MESIAATPTVPTDALEDQAGKAIEVVGPLGVIERLAGLQQQLEIAEIAVTQRVVKTKPLSEGGLESRKDLGTNHGIVQEWKRTQARQPNPRCAVAPRHEILPSRAGSRRGRVLAEVGPVPRLGREQAALVSNGREG